MTKYSATKKKPMIPDTPTPQPPFAQLAAFPNATPQRTRPDLITAIAIVGIVIASLGFLTSGSEAMSILAYAVMGTAMPGMRPPTQGATTVLVSQSVIGAALATMLLAGSIGLLRLRPWSRPLLLWWASLYLLSLFGFLLLQILIVMPSQMTTMSSMAQAMPFVFPTTTTATGAAAPTTSTSFSYTFNNGLMNTTTKFPATQPWNAAQMTPMMNASFLTATIGGTAICFPFPIVLLFILQGKTVRSALAPEPTVPSRAID